MSVDPAFATIGDLANRLRHKEFSAADLVNCYADRIASVNEATRAFISVDIERARAIAESLSIDPTDSPLKGIPYACKDLFDVKGMVTTGGSRVLADNIAEHDADAVARLHEAGMICLGKNNLHEFAYGATGENELYGTAPNPYDATRLAGGSSSGSAAAIGHGLCTASLGTDTGGSVRAPAALCGLVGFKPTFGRISTKGVIPFSWSLDHVGTLTRSAADTALLFNALVDSTAASLPKNIKGLRVGIPDKFFYERADHEILDCIEGFKQFINKAGAELKSVTLPSMEHSRTVALTIQMPEALSYHNRYLEQYGDLYSRDFRAGLALGQCLLAEQYVRARRFIESYRQDMEHVFKDVDVLLTLATPVIAPSIGSVQVSVDGQSEPAGNAVTRYTTFFNMTGHPALVLPCGMHSEGLPIAAQLIGKHNADEQLIATAAWIESAFDFELPLPEID